MVGAASFTAMLAKKSAEYRRLGEQKAANYRPSGNAIHPNSREVTLQEEADNALESQVDAELSADRGQLVDVTAIERCFGRLNYFRCFAARYDRRIVHFSGFVHLAAAFIWLR